MKDIKIILLLIFATLLSACSGNEEERSRINLAGEWQFCLDPKSVGGDENYARKEFMESVILPGTTDTNKKGELNTNTTETTQLSRIYKYIGKAWYKKEVDVPKSWSGKIVSMTLERTKPTHVWVDGKLVGKSDNISTKQVYELTESLIPGKHTITIMVDNGESVPRQLLRNSHAYTESTQTNWNGIIGDMFLEAKEELHIIDIQVSPNASNRVAMVNIEIANSHAITDGVNMELSAKAWNSEKRHKVPIKQIKLESGKSSYEVELDMGADALLWSEFAPTLYALKVSICGHDAQSVDFGLRDFRAEGTQFTINDQLTFLRGKHDACVFPLTAHTPMGLDSWRDYFKVCKEYGINHVRFHSWCPPKACFQAADIEGIYLQPELPFWGGLRRSDEYLSGFLLKEGINIQKEFGNHASFVMFALGNELSGDLDLMVEFTDKFREVDNRHIYAYGSSNYLGFKGQVAGEDFLVTCRIGGANDYSTHTRGSFSFADADQGGYINNTYPNSVTNFDGAIAKCSVPVISHETGQFQVYPNYNEIEKYSGVLSPVNIEIFRDRLEAAGMIDQADAFFRASGRWSAMLYKADIEMDLRTTGFGGFQLLDLQDYPGQGSAYVGILDAFMDNKGHISPEEWREFCNDVVPLFVTEKFSWTSDENLSGVVKIANYSTSNLDGMGVKWVLNDGSTVVDSGLLKIENNEKGLLEIGTITPNISAIKGAKKLMLTLKIEGTTYANRYPLWIYPNVEINSQTGDIMVSKKLDQNMVAKLESGGKVLWFPNKQEYQLQTIPGLFQTDYWNYRMFRGICENIGKTPSPGTLGILTDPQHPVFAEFPTDYHTNWQWYPIIKQSYPLILDRLPIDYRPIVQVIDNVERNHRLGLIFEFKVGEGSLLVCMSDLAAVEDKPEVRQLYNSIMNYMSSEKFDPEYKISAKSLKELFTTDASIGEIKGVINISYEN